LIPTDFEIPTPIERNSFRSNQVANDFLTTHFSLLCDLGGIFVGSAVLVLVAAVLIARLDRIAFEDALYLAVITALTVGFGDVSPTSRGARIIAVLLALLGLLLVGIVIGVAVHSIDTVLEHHEKALL